MLLNHSGRGSPPKPGWIGVSTYARSATAAAKPDTVCGPPPPCKTRMGRPLPRSSTRTVKPSAKDSLRVLGEEGGRVLMGFILSVTLPVLLKQAIQGKKTAEWQAYLEEDVLKSCEVGSRI